MCAAVASGATKVICMITAQHPFRPPPRWVLDKIKANIKALSSSEEKSGRPSLEISEAHAEQRQDVYESLGEYVRAVRVDGIHKTALDPFLSALFGVYDADLQTGAASSRRRGNESSGVSAAVPRA